MDYQRNDGGRAAAGFKGEASDCVCRAIAIATGHDYRETYDGINEAAKAERPRKRSRKRSRSSARSGVKKATTRRYMKSLGYSFISTMGIGTGCQIHLTASELPGGCLVIQLSGHVVAAIDGVVHDTHDPRRDGSRCVYGYYQITKEGDE